MIEIQQKRVQKDIGKTRGELEALGLQVTGGSVTHTVVVTGTAGRIADALRLPGVIHASLDQPLQNS